MLSRRECCRCSGECAGGAKTAHTSCSPVSESACVCTRAYISFNTAYAAVAAAATLYCTLHAFAYVRSRTLAAAASRTRKAATDTQLLLLLLVLLFTVRAHDSLGSRPSRTAAAFRYSACFLRHARVIHTSIEAHNLFSVWCPRRVCASSLFGSPVQSIHKRFLFAADSQHTIVIVQRFLQKVFVCHLTQQMGTGANINTPKLCDSDSAPSDLIFICNAF